MRNVQSPLSSGKQSFPAIKIMKPGDFTSNSKYIVERVAHSFPT